MSFYIVTIAIYTQWSSMDDDFSFIVYLILYAQYLSIFHLFQFVHFAEKRLE